MSDPALIGRGQLGRGLSLFGAAVLTWSPIVQFVHGRLPLWAFVGALIANAVWVTFVLLPNRFVVVPRICIGVMVVCGALSAAASDGSAVVPAAFAVLWLTRDIRIPYWPGLLLGVVTAVLIVVGDVLAPVTLLGVIAMEGGVLVAFLGGLSRRQFMVAELRSRELLEEQARTDVLAARTQLAAEIHDVLAHSLGGLVIQLDATEALLEAGDLGAATAKVQNARALAAEGLSEARRAVAALSEPPTDATVRVPAEQVIADVVALVRSHDSLGGAVDLRQTGVSHDVSKPLELALRRTVQEGLTNARRHAPGERVLVALSWHPGTVELRISNPVGKAVPSPGGGHGLTGMRDRFAALPGGLATAGRSGSEFVVAVKASTK